MARLAIAYLFCAITTSSVVDAAIVLPFSPGNFSTDTAAMDQTLGIDGFAIEDFEDTTLIPGLSISYTGNGFNDTISTLPVTRSFGQVWDGTSVLVNRPDNPVPENTTAIPDRITFHFATGAKSVGVGLVGFQSINPPSSVASLTDHRLYINGTAQAGTLETLVGADWIGSPTARNAYVRIDADGSEVINSIGFENITAMSGDFLQFDRLAVNAVPEPTSGALAVSCFALMSCARRKRRRQRLANAR